MENRELVDYILSVSDFPQERVKATLLQQGWTLEQIDSAVLCAQHAQSIGRASTTQNRQMVGMTLAVMLIAAVLFITPGTAVTGNVVYSSQSTEQNPSISVSEEVIQPSAQEEVLAPEHKTHSCASILNQIGQDKCFAVEAKVMSNVRMCSSIRDASRQTACVASIAAAKDARLCEAAKSRDNCAFAVAKMNRDKRACDLIANAPLHENCLAV